MFTILTKGMIFKGNKILILKRNINALYAAGKWDLPGGKLEFGETPLESLLREISEETSLEVEVNNILGISSGINKEKKKQYITTVYICKYKSGEVKCDQEHTDFAWVSLEEAQKFDNIYYLDDAIKNYIKGS